MSAGENSSACYGSGWGRQLPGKEVGEKGLVGPGGHKAKHELAVEPSSKEDQQHPGLH